MFGRSRSRKPTGVPAEVARNGTPIELVYPQYLNVSMMMSSLAYIEGGVTWEEQQRTLAGRQSGTAKAGTASVGASPSVLSLLSLDLRGNLSSKHEEQHGQEVTLVRRHTESSLFMQLRSKLRAAGLIVPLQEVVDAGHHQPCQLVEVSGEVARNPLVETLAAFDSVRPFMNAPGAHHTVHDRKSKQPQQDSSGLAMVSKVKDDLERSSLIDLVLSPDGDALPKCVLTLSREYLRDPSAEDLLGANLTVLGRITKVLREGESIDLLRRSVLGYLPAAARPQLFKAFAENPNFEMPITDTEIRHPAIQILPMALFV
jgi:hypothetical protein